MITKVGIDPSSNKSGVAILQNGRYTRLVKCNFIQLMALADGLPSDTMYYVEDPHYMRSPHRQLINDQTEMAKIRNMSTAVARCRQTAILICDMLESKGLTVVKVKPQKSLSKRAKTDKKWFERLTGWTGNSNKDTRDAAMLIYRYAHFRAP